MEPSSKKHSALVWLRRTLRLEDNPVLQAALSGNSLIVPVFIHDPDSSGPWAEGAASKWWLHHSLKSFSKALDGKGSRLILRKGNPADVLGALVKEIGATEIYADRCYEPELLDAETDIENALDVQIRFLNSNLLYEPGSIYTKQNSPYKVFTPFWRTCLATGEPNEPSSSPGKLPGPKTWPSSDSLDSFGLEPDIDWAGGLREKWTPGRQGALANLDRFLDVVRRYPEDRDRPDLEGTSLLAPHLHFGEISSREIWHAIRLHSEHSHLEGFHKGAESFLRQLGWREFAHHLLFHFPDTSDHPLRPEFADYPWRRNQKALKAWQKGRTGYPIVDAGMRELWGSGWMHNRVRMIAASFLVKDLLIPWQEGARWFWDTLVDADLANNSLGWQWVAGSGADAAPYFRIFNPITQGQKFDPSACYIRKWVPELAALPDKWIHKPWMAPEHVLETAGIRMDRDYPQPIVDHADARDRALEGYTEMLASTS
jgi:deoxyribodipyrimidine photo-lyase